jgi:hypothetical protein
MHIPSLPMNVFTNAVSQALSSPASRATSGEKSFESDLVSGNISGAQSFLSTLQTKLSLGSSGAAGSAISAQIAKVGNDLKLGNLTAAQADFSHLKLAVSNSAGLAASNLNQSIDAAGSASDSSLAALASYNSLQQSAFAGAVNLSMPGNVPSLSVNL